MKQPAVSLGSILSGLSPEVRVAAQRLAERPPAAPEALLAAVADHLRNVEAAPSDLVDRPLARQVAAALERLIREAWPSAPAEARQLIQLAAGYFVSDQDAEGDLDSPLGFEDDAELLNSVAIALGRPDLRVEI